MHDWLCTITAAAAIAVSVGSVLMTNAILNSARRERKGHEREVQALHDTIASQRTLLAQREPYQPPG